MIAVRTIRACRRYILPGGDSANDLWVEDRRDEKDGAPVIGSTWQPTAEEREAIANGANIELLVWGTGQPPVYIGTSDVMIGAFTLEENEKDATIDLREDGKAWEEAAARTVGQRFRAETYANGGQIAGDLNVLYRDPAGDERIVVVRQLEEESG